MYEDDPYDEAVWEFWSAITLHRDVWFFNFFDQLYPGWDAVTN